jgi:tryptophanyl-tRNA synthetase
VIDHLGPVRERYGELRGDEDRLEQILAEGARRARELAAPTLAEVRRRMGLGPGGR